MNGDDESESMYQPLISLLLIILQDEIADKIAVDKCLKTSEQNHDDSAAVHRDFC